MTTIVSFNASAQLVMPTESNSFPIHLGEVDGRHYLSVPEGFDIPPAQAEDTGYVVHDAPLESGIVKRLMAVREINAGCVAAIRAKYSIDDELGAKDHAQREGLYIAANNRYRRRMVTFRTELEGMIPPMAI